MGNLVLITARGQDQVGLIASLTGALFDLGANLEDTSFHSIAGQFDYQASGLFPEGLTTSEIEAALRDIEQLETVDLSVTLTGEAVIQSSDATVTHLISVRGTDRPGLVARISEVLTQYQANIVRMNSHKLDQAGAPSYATHFSVCVGDAQEKALDNALSNLAGSLRLTLVFAAQ